MVYLTLALCLSIVGNVVLTLLHYREKREIFDRYMAGDYAKYMYHQKIQPIEAEDFKKKLEAERKVKTEKTEAQIDRERRAEAY